VCAGPSAKAAAGNKSGNKSRANREEVAACGPVSRRRSWLGLSQSCAQRAPKIRYLANVLEEEISGRGAGGTAGNFEGKFIRLYSMGFF
jgi:hypothetical protein